VVKEVLVGTTAALVVLLAMWGVDVTPFLLLGGIVLVFRYAFDGKGGLGKSLAQVGAAATRKNVPAVSFDDIGGQEVAKRELLEALQFIKEDERTRKLGIRPLKGILLAGPPGTGKTLLAKAAANYADAAFLAVSGSEFVEVYAGVGAQRVRRLFKQAKAAAVKEGKSCAVIFIDEIEVLGGRRGKHTSHLEYDQTLNELLVQMDGMMSDEGGVRVLVMAATNRPDLLDPALLRPGRFDRTVQVDMPDREGRLHILKIHTRRRPLADDVDLDLLAREMYNFSGAQIESVVNEAAIHAMRAGRDEIRLEDFKEAIEKVMMGERLDRKPRSEELERIAHHEAGHALISELVRPGSVSSITITSRGKALGYMRQAPQDDPYLYTKQELLDQIAICMAGACAEEIFFGSRSTGSVGDIRQAMAIAEQIVAAGMSSLGVVDMDVLSPKVLHDEMQAIVKEQEEYVRRQLEACRDQVQQVACLLLEREKISGEEFRAIVGPLAPVSACQSA
jgi:ATP-dependent Zn proteases